MRITYPRLRFPSPALVVACLAFVAALTGGAFAATSSNTGSIQFTNATLNHDWRPKCCRFGYPGYAKDALGVVHLRGEILDGAFPTTAFVLPRGLRPSHYLYLPDYTYGGASGGRVEIKPNGDVVPLGREAIRTTSLDGVSFAAGE